MVDIGTGYFVEQDIPKSQAFLDRKIKMVEDNMKAVNDKMEERQKHLETVVMIMQQRITAQYRQSQQKTVQT